MVLLEYAVPEAIPIAYAKLSFSKPIVTEFDALDDEPLPAAFRADTVNV